MKLGSLLNLLRRSKMNKGAENSAPLSGGFERAERNV